MPSTPKHYGKWVLIVWGLATASTLVSFVGWLLGNESLYRIPQAIAGMLGFVLIYLVILYSHQIKMEGIQETLANVRARKKVVPVDDQWLKDTINQTAADERDFVNIWTSGKKED